ncbi:hypothetical protein BB559_007461 [Furculomyces boomerangus]|uniref:Uncharacterized protein n=2 Tax=Harpellales TaxID=61421 RepID=A0A2T9XX89_9FUNG|nr:hypothetical protein BB559_007475 [Furculomyces boomerangus]PVU84694.1 hypothetical protein BB559_007461 [Furculomyces boomerangus]
MSVRGSGGTAKTRGTMLSLLEKRGNSNFWDSNFQNTGYRASLDGYCNICRITKKREGTDTTKENDLNLEGFVGFTEAGATDINGKSIRGGRMNIDANLYCRA